MPSYPIPADEFERLQTLRDFSLLDEGDDPDFDDLVQLAAVICDVPISLVTFIDAEREIYKARVGLRSTGTTRAISFCAHAINQRDLFIVRDARLDERFQTNHAVVNPPHVRFYAGMPIVARGNVALGTLCVIDHHPRELDARQRESLRLLGRIAGTHVKNRIETLKAKREC